MKSFFEGFEHEDAELIESLSRASYEMRENRKMLLEKFEVADEHELLTKILAGKIPEHPAYEHYLSAIVLTETQEAIRAELGEIMKEVKAI